MNRKISLMEFGRIVKRIVKRIVTEIVTIFHSIFLFKVKADGNCMLQSILEQVSMKTEGVMNRYSSIYLRRQVINHELNNIEILKPFFGKEHQGNLWVGGGGHWSFQYLLLF